MRIRSTFDIQFHLLQPTPMVSMLRLHPSIDQYLEDPEVFLAENLDTNTAIPVDDYLDVFGNRCQRFVAPAGKLRLSGNSIVISSNSPDIQGFGLLQTPVEQLPYDALQFLVASRYCEVDRFGGIAQDLFAHMGTGWALAAAIRDWVYSKVAFDYATARTGKTAMDVYSERIGVCRDYQHLAITLSRCMNLPARYVTGYIGDIRSPNSGPGDFSAWYQVWLGGKWWDMDARHNFPRYGRILMAVGRDAADVAITTSFGRADLTHFFVSSDEIDDNNNPVPLPPKL